MSKCVGKTEFEVFPWKFLRQFPTTIRLILTDYYHDQEWDRHRTTHLYYRAISTSYHRSYGTLHFCFVTYTSRKWKYRTNLIKQNLKKNFLIILISELYVENRLFPLFPQFQCHNLKFSKGDMKKREPLRMSRTFFYIPELAGLILNLNRKTNKKEEEKTTVALTSK